MYLEKNKCLPSAVNEWSTEFVGMRFVSKLLMLALEKQPDEISIIPNEFVSGAGGTVKTTDTLKAQIIVGEIVGTGEQIEINLSGTIENDYGHNEKFTLYLILWPNRSVDHLLRSGVKKNVEACSLEMDCEHLSIYLPDSVFGLDLSLIDKFGQQITLGQGRGYLVFGETT